MDFTICFYNPSLFYIFRVVLKLNMFLTTMSMSLSPRIFKICERYDTGDKKIIAIIDNLSVIIYLKT
jgi:hypothetical protein